MKVSQLIKGFQEMNGDDEIACLMWEKSDFELESGKEPTVEQWAQVVRRFEKSEYSYQDAMEVLWQALQEITVEKVL